MSFQTILNWFLPIFTIFIVLYPIYIAKNKTEYPKTFTKINKFVLWISKIVEPLNISRKISEFGFSFSYNFNEDVLIYYITDSNILEEFKNKIVKILFLKTKPDLSIDEIRNFFKSIFEQYKFLYLGLCDFITEKSNHNSSEILFELTNNQIMWLTENMKLSQFKTYNHEIFDRIEEKLVNNPDIGFNCLLNDLVEKIMNESAKRQKVFEWLAKNRYAFININPKNKNLIFYYNQLHEDIKSNIQINHVPITTKKSEISKTKPQRLQDVLISDLITEERYMKIIEFHFDFEYLPDDNYDLYTKGKRRELIPDNSFSFFYEKLQNEKFINKEIYCPDQNKIKLLSKFFNKKLGTSIFTRGLNIIEKEEFISKYILSMDCKNA